MNTIPRTIVSLLAIPSLLSAAPRPEATAVNDDDEKPATIRIEIVDDKGVPLPEPSIDKDRSAATDLTGSHLSVSLIGNDGNEVPVSPPPTVKISNYSGGKRVSAIGIHLSGKVSADSVYRVTLRPGDGKPTLVYNSGDGDVTVNDNLTFNVRFKEAIPEAAKPLKPSMAIGGGSDGTLLSLRWSAGGSTTSDGEFGRWFASIEADLSPGDDGSESMVTGRIAGDLEGLWRVIDTRDQYIDVTTYFGVATDFESSQDFDNWDAELGLSSWWFFQGRPIQTVGNLLRISSDDYPSHPIALKLSADYVFAYERGTGIADPEDMQVSARLMWLSRIYTDARLPFMDAPIDVNLLVDVGTTWEPDSSKLHPETKLSLEFEPQAYKDSKLAFALTWAQGEFSPTFVDEDAFLAGIKLRF